MKRKAEEQKSNSVELPATDTNMEQATTSPIGNKTDEKPMINDKTTFAKNSKPVAKSAPSTRTSKAKKEVPAESVAEAVIDEVLLVSEEDETVEKGKDKKDKAQEKEKKEKEKAKKKAKDKKAKEKKKEKEKAKKEKAKKANKKSKAKKKK
jgi:hypothetical protein